MKLPNVKNVVVSATKITEYLLSETHTDGKHKAKVFQAFGFSLDDCPALEQAVRQHAADHELAKVEPSSFGTRYVVEGIMGTPDGRSLLIRSVWFIRNKEENPQFVTAYPLRRSDDD
ncbi:MAG: hypothetical protein IID45_05090 [Planctomycetes bacterium]|nr:hypothetical protein [Planctomycetota bacterium]